jgi:hypothetical protein
MRTFLKSPPSQVGPAVRIHFPPAASQLRTRSRFKHPPTSPAPAHAPCLVLMPQVRRPQPSTVSSKAPPDWTRSAALGGHVGRSASRAASQSFAAAPWHLGNGGCDMSCRRSGCGRNPRSARSARCRSAISIWSSPCRRDRSNRLPTRPLPKPPPRQISIGNNRPGGPRGFLTGGLSDAGPSARGSVTTGRHPKPFT